MNVEMCYNNSTKSGCSKWQYMAIGFLYYIQRSDKLKLYYKPQNNHQKKNRNKELSLISQMEIK